jgi:UDP-3-O-[3-hydroxymyristoyl] glucosamine N-acyltransferase
MSLASISGRAMIGKRLTLDQAVEVYGVREVEGKKVVHAGSSEVDPRVARERDA